MLHREHERFVPTPQAAWGVASAAALDAGLRGHMLRVYNWMASGLLLTAIVAYAVATVPSLSEVFWTAGRSARGVEMHPTLLGWGAILSPLAFVLVMGLGLHRMSLAALQTAFWAFCAAMGVSTSNLLHVYVGASVAGAFISAAGMFAATSLYGYTTRRDLTGMGSFLMMGLVGILLAGVVNLFVGSTALSFAVNAVGVAVFAGLTAWDTQRLKADYLADAGRGGEAGNKVALMGALSLYLNFVNLFQMLLSLTGTRRE